MGKSGKIGQYRERLDKTLAAAELTNIDALKTLIRKQILHSSPNEYEGCSENVIEKRATEVSNFLDMLRSASISESKVSKTTDGSPGEWKLKDDNEDYRVMYREGPKGSPFHTLLVEGYVDGPLDSCLCISWESNMYKKWWVLFRLCVASFCSTTCQWDLLGMLHNMLSILYMFVNNILCIQLQSFLQLLNEDAVVAPSMT
uniref:Uncharacterized protein MANES_09G043100 n=2 Tax=Rhizophora mucronata TaxID=61149 RepID=A0A2P2MCU0_RHIMU